MSRWKVVYDLNEDSETIQLVQKATLETDHFGLIPEVALFGTPEWWEAIRDGRIAKVVVEGRIRRLLSSGHKDWPEFEIEEKSGAVSRWTLVGNTDSYREGSRARIEYVMQKAKAGPLGPVREQKNVLRILVQGCDQNDRAH
jgi:hypothetical protein